MNFPRVILLLGLAALPALAQEGFILNGNLDVSALNLRSNEGSTGVLNQKYALTCNRSFTPYLSADAALHYSNQDQNFEGARTYQNDLQPMGQVSWNTPWFAFGAHGERHITETDVSESDLTRDNGSLNLRTKPDSWPMLNLGLDVDRLYTPNNLDLRDVYENNLMGGLNWQYKSQILSYNAAEQQTRNVNVSTTEYRNNQNFRWNQATDLLGRKLRLRSDYALNYQSEKFEKPDSVPVLEWVPNQKAYYTVDPSPEFSVMDSVEGLMDGNKTTPASPQILVGPQNLYGNIAMDFGTRKEIGAVFLYTNRRVSSAGIWTVYASDAAFFSNEMQWQPIGQDVVGRFDDAYLRFEITFPNASVRFLKVVFKGTTDTANVAITELEALRRDVGTASNMQKTSTQIISLNSTYLFSERYDASLDVGFQNEPLSSGEAKKKMTSISRSPAINVTYGPLQA